MVPAVSVAWAATASKADLAATVEMAATAARESSVAWAAAAGPVGKVERAREEVLPISATPANQVSMAEAILIDRRE